MNVLRAYRSLNAEQKRILRDKRVDLNRPIDELLALLRPLANCDAIADKSRTKLGCTFAAGIVAVVVATVVLSDDGWLGLLAIVAIAAIMIGAGALFFWSRGIDVSNNFRQFALPVLTVLREDIAPGERVHVKLDLRAPNAKEKLQSESAPYKQGVYHKVIDKTFLDAWMSAEATLVDGTRLAWSVTDAIRERSKTKRTPRGKYKSKTKVARKTHLDVEVALRNKRYAIGDAPPDAEVKSDDKRTVVRLERLVRSTSLDPVSPGALIDLVAAVYRNATLVKKEARA